MAEVHVTTRPIDGSGNQIVFHNPDNANGGQPLPASDVPAPSKSGVQTTVKVVGTPGSAVRLQGVIVPFARSITTFDDLRNEAEFLAAAEGMNRSWKWGAIGLLKSASSEFPADLLKEWTTYFREKTPRYEAFAGHTRSEAPAISPDGFLKMNWPLSRKDSAKYDFLFATPTKAEIQNDANLKQYPSAKEIAALVPADATRYFINNVLKGIRTSEDAAIWKALTKLDSEFAEKWPRVSSLLGENAE